LRPSDISKEDRNFIKKSIEISKRNLIALTSVIIIITIIIITTNLINKKTDQSSGTLIDSSISRGLSRSDTMILPLWETQSIRVKCINDTQNFCETVMMHASKWTDSTGIKFVLVDSGDSADIRVSFDKTQTNWSALGKNALDTPQNKPTMNINPQYDTYSFRGLVLSRFGLALGLIKEHMNSDANIPWDTTEVLLYYQKEYKWTKDQTRFLILKKYDKILPEWRDFDPKSVMMDAIVQPELTKRRFTSDFNSQLSESDKKLIKKLYPKVK
ncbi:MAG: hypothetical protein WCF67_02445, partial [Chitinophagaceae bacterium]